MTVYRGELPIAGRFDRVDGIAAHNIARLRGTHWQPLAAGLDNPATSPERFCDQLVVSGRFSVAGISHSPLDDYQLETARALLLLTFGLLCTTEMACAQTRVLKCVHADVSYGSAQSCPGDAEAQVQELPAHRVTLTKDELKRQKAHENPCKPMTAEDWAQARRRGELYGYMPPHQQHRRKSARSAKPPRIGWTTKSPNAGCACFRCAMLSDSRRGGRRCWPRLVGAANGRPTCPGS